MPAKVLYFHGQGGSAGEAEHYRAFFQNAEVIGVDYAAETPWEAAEEFPRLFNALVKENEEVTLIANSIGAFFSMLALRDKPIKTAFFISPVADMETLILRMMTWASVSEEELRAKGEIETAFGQTLSWKYLSYVREHPVAWHVPTHILYGAADHLMPLAVIKAFAEKTDATLTVMENGEHWFHTEEQMLFLDRWIKERI